MLKKIFLTLFLTGSCFALSSTFTIAKDNYSYQLLKPEAATSIYAKPSKVEDLGTKSHVLFIVDFSNSMNDRLGKQTKLEVALDTLNSILPQIPPTVKTGLRVYGHRSGLTYMQGCTASKLLVPMEQNNSYAIQAALAKTQAVGWTPITYSLKSAVRSDFAGVEGKKHIVLLTDGGENCDESPCTYAIELMKTRDDISIDVIAFDIYDDDAKSQLQCTALMTSGKFYTANSKEELRKSLFNSLNVDREVKAIIRTSP